MSSLEVQTRSPSLALLFSVHLVLLAHDGDTVFQLVRVNSLVWRCDMGLGRCLDGQPHDVVTSSEWMASQKTRTRTSQEPKTISLLVRPPVPLSHFANLAVVHMDSPTSDSNPEVLTASRLWCSQRSGLIVLAMWNHKGIEVLEVHPIEEPYHTTVLAEDVSVLTLLACQNRHCCGVTCMFMTQGSLDVDGRLSCRRLCCPIAVHWHLARGDRNLHSLPATAALLAPLVVHLRVPASLL